MYIFFTILIILTCALLALIILVQNSKGGGLTSNFASQNQYMGVKKTGDFLEKATWTLAIALFVFCIGASWTIDKGGKKEQKAAYDVPAQIDKFDINQVSTPAMDDQKTTDSIQSVDK